MARLHNFFASAPKAIKSAGRKLRTFSQRPIGRVLIGVGLVAGIGAALMATGGTAAAAAPAATTTLASSGANTAGLWKAFGFTALAVGYVYGQVQVGLAMSRAWENRQRQKEAEDAKKKAREDKLAELKDKLHGGEKSGAKPPKAERRRKLPQPA